ncbi:hypothetical protein [Oceaniglobus roseus]|uniref:hypothetical protein n=1 Tax=Oceaniglobus roseus TaxID=1737570 RepID=UPI000C7EB417|nr:hypothetical protein [Kandeliimicrobium roseum]
MNQLVNMIVRMFLNKGINAGIDRMSGGRKPTRDMTPEERAQARAGRQNAKRAKQALRVVRRIGRF